MPEQNDEEYLYGGGFDDRFTAFARQVTTDYKDYNNLLLQSFISGRTLLLNDGYIFQHPQIQEDLKREANGEKSLLFTLAEEGQIIVVAREGANGTPLELLPFQKSAPPSLRNVHKYLEDNNSWGDVEKGLKTLDKRCRRVSWPNYHKEIAFCRVMAMFYHSVSKSNSSQNAPSNNANNKLNDQFCRCFDAFHDYIVKSGNQQKTRTTWENIIKGFDPAYDESKDKTIRYNPAPPLNKQEHGDPEVREKLMAIANLAYHYAFVACYRNQGGGISNTLACTASQLVPDFAAYLAPKRNRQIVADDIDFSIKYPVLFSQAASAASGQFDQWDKLRNFVVDKKWKTLRAGFSNLLDKYNCDPTSENKNSLMNSREQLNNYAEQALAKIDPIFLPVYYTNKFLRRLENAPSWSGFLLTIQCDYIADKIISFMQDSFASISSTLLQITPSDYATFVGVATGVGLAGYVLHKAWNAAQSRMASGTPRTLIPETLWVEGAPFKAIINDLPLFDSNNPGKTYGESVLFPEFKG